MTTSAVTAHPRLPPTRQLSDRAPSWALLNVGMHSGRRDASGRLHCGDGPAVDLPEVTEWWCHGSRHCYTGPAYRTDSGHEGWFVHGHNVSAGLGDHAVLNDVLACDGPDAVEELLRSWTPTGPSVRELRDAMRYARL